MKPYLPSIHSIFSQQGFTKTLLNIGVDMFHTQPFHVSIQDNRTSHQNRAKQVSHHWKLSQIDETSHTVPPFQHRGNILSVKISGVIYRASSQCHPGAVGLTIDLTKAKVIEVMEMEKSNLVVHPSKFLHQVGVSFVKCRAKEFQWFYRDLLKWHSRALDLTMTLVKDNMIKDLEVSKLLIAQ